MSEETDRLESAMISQARKAWQDAGVKKPKVTPCAKVTCTTVFEDVRIRVTKSQRQDGSDCIDMQMTLPENYLTWVVHQPWAKGWKSVIVLDGRIAGQYPGYDVFKVRVARNSKGYDAHIGTTFAAVRDGKLVASGSSPNAAYGRARAGDVGQELAVLLPTLGPETPMCAKVRLEGGDRWYIVRQNAQGVWQFMVAYRPDEGSISSPYVCDRSTLRGAIARAWRWFEWDLLNRQDKVEFNNLPPTPKTKRAIKEEDQHQRMVRNITQMDQREDFATVLL